MKYNINLEKKVTEALKEVLIDEEVIKKITDVVKLIDGNHIRLPIFNKISWSGKRDVQAQARACFDEDEICLVTKDCLNSGLDIEQLFIMETEESDSYEGDVKLFVGKNQDEKYLCDGANSIRCSLFGVLRLCKNSDVINLIQMGE